MAVGTHSSDDPTFGRWLDAWAGQRRHSLRGGCPPAAARDNACAAEWAFHELLLVVKDQVRAQFGPSSNEWQSLGQKKKSEIRRQASGKTTKPAA